MCWSCRLKNQWLFIKRPKADAKLSHIVQCSLPKPLKLMSGKVVYLRYLCHICLHDDVWIIHFLHTYQQRGSGKKVLTLNQLVACHCRSLPPCSFFVFIQTSLSRACSCQNPLQWISPKSSSTKWSSVHSSFIIPLLLAVGYQIIISQEVKLVKKLLPIWEVFLPEVILHIGTQVEWEAFFGWLFLCLIVPLQNAFGSDYSVPEIV